MDISEIEKETEKGLKIMSFSVGVDLRSCTSEVVKNLRHSFLKRSENGYFIEPSYIICIHKV
jgi:hypothetical protein